MPVIVKIINSAVEMRLEVGGRVGMSVEEAKRRVGEYACRFVKDGYVLALGSGSTAAYFVRALGRKVQEEGMKVQAIPSSYQIMRVAVDAAVPLTTLIEHPEADLDIDGADEVDPDLNLVKGGGGALTSEKILAAASKEYVVIVDYGKRVDRLGSRYPIPVEIIPYAYRFVSKELTKIGGEPALRLTDKKGEVQPFITENGNFILDTRFATVTNPYRLQDAIKRIPGVVEHGLFLGMTKRVCVGYEDRVEVLERKV